MRWLGSALLAATLPLAAPAASAPSPICVPRTTAPSIGLRVTATMRLTGRATVVTFASKAMNGAVHAVVILPNDYAAKPGQRYPVLYLLHGHGGRGYLDWPNHGVESVIGSTPMIVVIPEGGYDGFYSDWYGTDVDGHTPAPAPAWESFHIRELLPWVDATYRTVPSRTGRAVAGNSMGGFGAASYAARHPDLFVAAGAFSGAVHPLLVWPIGPLLQAPAANLADQQPPDQCIWGDPFTQHVRWADHDPTELAANLGALAVYQRTGDGTAGRYDDFAAKQPSPGAVLNEFGIGLMNRSFDEALNEGGVVHTAVFEHGIHDWPYWLDDLREFLPMARQAFASPPDVPPRVPFSYTSGAATFSVWDWTFTTDHVDEAALVTVDRVGRHGLRATGAGRLHVDTAPLYSARAVYRVNGVRQRADNSGRLHFDMTPQRRGTLVTIRRAG